jgi:hypothetical protein
MALGLAACGGGTTLDTTQLEEQIAQELLAQGGVAAASVECPPDVEIEGSTTFECVARAEDGSTATITATADEEGSIDWEVTSTG